MTKFTKWPMILMDGDIFFSDMCKDWEIPYILANSIYAL